MNAQIYGTDCLSTDYDTTPRPMTEDEARAEVERMVREDGDLAGALFGDSTPYPRRYRVGEYRFELDRDGTIRGVRNKQDETADAQEKIDRLAEEFTAILEEWLTPMERVSVAEGHKTEDGYTCSTHDFCDPNQAMLDALERIGEEYVFSPDDRNDTEQQRKHDEQVYLMESAWDRARVMWRTRWTNLVEFEE